MPLQLLTSKICHHDLLYLRGIPLCHVTSMFMIFQTCYLTRFCLLVNSEYSMQLNASRIKVLQAQDDLVNKMKDDAMKELLLVSHNHHEYKNLLKDLIVQVRTKHHTHISMFFF
jgi:hypothetical protein